jgi:hypothetical protein
MKVCDRCGKETEKHYRAFSKIICEQCKNNRPNKGTGNSGMFSDNQSIFCFSEELVLQRCKKSDKTFGRLFFTHYPESKGIVGRSLCYLVIYKNQVAGIIACSSPPKNYKHFREYFNTTDDNLYVNNNVFRLVLNEPNLGTKTLKLFRERIAKDYEKKYGTKLIGIVTFVEPPRTGAMYKADNWNLLGETQGIKVIRRENFEKQYIEGTKKLIYGKKFIKQKQKQK